MDYEKPNYLTTLFSGIMLLVCMGLYYNKIKLEEKRDLLPVFSLLLTVTYALPLFNAASH
ncbi:hypothetical protein [Paenibacillus etheri]|uniref:hypothetical protein n=1 Tax=Paenibacillus etheri TaxID=1306852 RepID=UPI001ADF4461|nr:hypothetical protein [Paenibacillus etheri]